MLGEITRIGISSAGKLLADGASYLIDNGTLNGYMDQEGWNILKGGGMAILSSVGTAVFDYLKETGGELLDTIFGGMNESQLADSFRYAYSWCEEQMPTLTKIVTDTLSVPIGKTENGITCLDLHENADGPHMLVAGTTGSGKSETIITYLLGLCLYFRPDEVNLMLVDMKGGGFIKRIGTLPHVVGSVTDVDGDENGTGAEYMLKRFLDSLRSEIKRRKILFNSMHVDSINQYIAACRNIDSHIKKINNRLRGEDKEPMTQVEEKAIRDQAKENSLAHLVLVVDEFTELKRFSSENNDVDFIGEITTIARVGRSLGFHIILISQNIEGAITDDIRVNSKSRLCLKVATRQASKEMLGNDLAASPTMPGHGRAYLMVGTGSKFEYFQSGYAGAAAEDNFEFPVEITEASKGGVYTKFYRSEKDNTDAIRRRKELEDQGRLETQLNAVTGKIKTYYNQHRSEYPKIHMIFEKPLPGRIVYESGRIYEEKDGSFELLREVRE